MLTQTERMVIDEFKYALMRRFKEKIISISIFGSKARGDDTPESDIDVCIIVSRRTPAIRDAILDIAFDINLKYNLYISPRVISSSVLKHPIWKHTPFIRNIQKESIAI